MNYGKLLAIASMVLAIGACVGYLVAGDYRKAAYWFFGACITGAVTF